MGQPIAVTRTTSPRPGVLRFEINRTLTGMGHERYESPDDVVDDRPPDELARRLFARDGVRRLHIYSNVITIELDDAAKAVADGPEAEAIAEIIRSLYIHYTEGVVPSFGA